jgi:Ca-activated chloride channel family protein
MGELGYALTAAKVAVSRLLSASLPDDEYFLEYVSSWPKMQCQFTSDLRQLPAVLNVSPNGRTALVDAMYLALQAMRQARNSNRALLVISDGYENSSVYNARELFAAFSDQPTPMFLLIPHAPPFRIGPRGPTMPEGVIELHDRLVQLATESGGYALSVSNVGQLISAAMQFGNAIRSPYVLSFRKPPQGATNHNFNLRVETNGRPRPILLYTRTAFASRSGTGAISPSER